MNQHRNRRVNYVDENFPSHSTESMSDSEETQDESRVINYRRLNLHTRIIPYSLS